MLFRRRPDVTLTPYAELAQFLDLRGREGGKEEGRDGKKVRDGK